MNSSEILNKYNITYRQLYYWTTAGFISDDKKLIGNGGRREYTDREVLVLERMIALVQAGVTVPMASAIARGDRAYLVALSGALELCRE